MKSLAADLLVLAGCAMVAAGFWLWSPALALVFMGILLAVAGIAIGAPKVITFILAIICPRVLKVPIDPR